MDRRDFLKATSLVAALTAGKLTGIFGRETWAAEGAAANDASKVVAVRGNDPAAMFRQGIAALGGIAAFVKPRQKVIVKPNIGWDKTPELAANTNPNLVGEIVRQALAAGASEVGVLDHTCDHWHGCYKNSGIAQAVEAAGGKMLLAHEESAYVERQCASAKILKSAKIHRAVLDCDVLINVPVLKNHGGAKMTGALKNYMGVIWDRGFMHSHNLHQTIADLPFYRPADLTVVDAYRVVTSRGPKGGSANDVKLLGYQLLSRDMVAADALAVKLIGYRLADVPHIEIASNMGLGSIANAENLTRIG
ncbi:hypothetical protein FACS1894107_12130 [Planctomycetales bacterium]|nr:hypothetical protein FACS1894107_12130 [Planctomycetales bacterium]GHS97140.1 hypothetical protein FACS1894108_02990 [Planctomycetales bacterium]